MNSFKQALNRIRVDWKRSLILGLVSTVYVLACRFAPAWVGAFLLSLGLIAFQEVADHLNKNEQRVKPYSGKNIASAFIIAIVLIPTAGIFGSSIGLLESPQGAITNYLSALVLFMVATYFFMVLSQAFRFHHEARLSIARTIDIVGLVSFKNLRQYGVLAFYSGLGIMIAIMTKGAGLVVVLPLILYVNYYTYQNNYADFTARAQR